MPVHHELSELVVLLIELGSRKQLFLTPESLCRAGMLVSYKASSPSSSKLPCAAEASVRAFHGWVGSLMTRSRPTKLGKT